MTPSAIPVALPPCRQSPRDWWREPRLTWWTLIFLAAGLALRHPSALHTPQLWAEDGSVFLVENDLHGAKAFLLPYAGYLHTIPRLIAWLASGLLDPCHWPAFYNATAFLITLSVVARTFSRRLLLPGKPWIALSFFLGPHTGEVLFNVTNLQWVTAIALVQLALMARPVTAMQRVGDVAVLVVVGLTGPFVALLLPLFAWRWWRDRDRDAMIALLVAALCAIVQGWFMWKFVREQAPAGAGFSVGTALVLIGRRLVTVGSPGTELEFAL